MVNGEEGDGVEHNCAWTRAWQGTGVLYQGIREG